MPRSDQAANRGSFPRSRLIAALAVGVFVVVFLYRDRSATRGGGLGAAGAANSATGRVFSGKAIRTYTGPLVDFSKPANTGIAPVRTSRGECNSDRWAVVTTIYAPSRAIELAAQLDGWCVVIVADTKTPETAYAELRRNPSVVFLSVERQRRWAAQGRRGRAFVAAVPWRHFARKNIGYLHAIQQGANFIFDVDDDNELKTDAHGRPLDPMPPDLAPGGRGAVITPVGLARGSPFNPYPLMQPSLKAGLIWPRGFPLDQVNTPRWRPDGSAKGSTRAVRQDPARIAVVQLLADHDPDVDAVYVLANVAIATF